jgi:hypothetical protein
LVKKECPLADRGHGKILFLELELEVGLLFYAEYVFQRIILSAGYHSVM